MGKIRMWLAFYYISCKVALENCKQMLKWAHIKYK